MPQPPQEVDTLCEDLLQDLPPETVEMARACKAFSRARKIKTPVQWLRRVLRSCGLDQSLRDVVGNDTLLPSPTALALYRVRWQIAIASKRWKSVLDVDLLRARYESPLEDVWLHGTWR